MSLRREFVEFARVEGVDVRGLCRRFGVSATTGYKWMARYDEDGPEGLRDRSRRPRTSPARTPGAMEERVVVVRCEHPAWGARKIRRRLQDLGVRGVPAPSTITAILRRHGLISPDASVKHTAFCSFEMSSPNELWQMDFKGHFPLVRGRCHPLTVLDDHSRFAVGLRACGNETGATVRPCLIDLFRRYGLPWRMLADNGGPWGARRDEGLHTALTVWLLRLGVGVIHSRPRHAQTLGKDERFHRSLKDEVVGAGGWRDLAHCQGRFDRWREIYNHERPHEALDLGVPADRYEPSPRPYPESLAPIEYPAGLATRKVRHDGYVRYRGGVHYLSQAFRGYWVGLRPTAVDGVVEILFSHHVVGRIDLRDERGTAHNV